MALARHKPFKQRLRSPASHTFRRAAPTFKPLNRLNAPNVLLLIPSEVPFCNRLNVLFSPFKRPKRSASHTFRSAAPTFKPFKRPKRSAFHTFRSAAQMFKPFKAFQRLKRPASHSFRSAAPTFKPFKLSNRLNAPIVLLLIASEVLLQR